MVKRGSIPRPARFPNGSGSERETMNNESPSRYKAKCVECERVFDLLDEADAEEYFYGHDCEA